MNRGCGQSAARQSTPSSIELDRRPRPRGAIKDRVSIHDRPETIEAAARPAIGRATSWQKGGVENANGRLRQWLPRHLDIDRTSDRDIQEIVLTTNLAPRKRRGFKTPLQALGAAAGAESSIACADFSWQRRRPREGATGTHRRDCFRDVRLGSGEHGDRH